MNRNEIKMHGPYKVIVVGDKNTGKSSFIEYLHIPKQFREHFRRVRQQRMHGPNGIGPRLGPPFVRINYDLFVDMENDDTTSRKVFGKAFVDLWEIDEKPSRHFYEAVHGAIIMCDVSDSQDIEKNVNMWKREIRQNCGNVPIVVCGNKKDLLDGWVDENEGNGNENFILSSMHTEDNVDLVIIRIIRCMTDRYDLILGK